MPRQPSQFVRGPGDVRSARGGVVVCNPRHHTQMADVAHPRQHTSVHKANPPPNHPQPRQPLGVAANKRMRSALACVCLLARLVLRASLRGGRAPPGGAAAWPRRTGPWLPPQGGCRSTPSRACARACPPAPRTRPRSPASNNATASASASERSSAIGERACTYPRGQLHGTQRAAELSIVH